MNGYEKAVSLNLVGTTEEIIEQLKSISLHHRDVYITGGPANTESVNILHLLTARHQVMTMGFNQQWQGPLIDFEASNPSVARIMSLLRPHLQVNNTMVYCSISEEAADMLNALTEIIGILTGKPEQVRHEVAILSGGRIGADYADLTVEQYESQAAESQLNARKNELKLRLQQERESFDARYNYCISGIDSGVITTDGDIMASLGLGG